MINPDLITNRQDTETENLDVSTKTPDRRRRISIQDPRLCGLGGRGGRSSPLDTSQLNHHGRRSPTPIKIVDLSAIPVPLPTPGTSIKQEYLRHFPLLNSKKPLKQEQLRNMMAKGQDQTRTMPNAATDPRNIKQLT